MNHYGTKKAALYAYDEYMGGGGYYADIVEVSNKPTHSQLLDAKGQPIRYEPTIKVGFDLRRKSKC